MQKVTPSFDSDVDSEDEFGPVLSDDGRASPTLLSDQMRSRYRRTKFQDGDKRLPRFPNFKKYLKFPKHSGFAKSTSPIVHSDAPEAEEDAFANREAH